MSIWVYSNQNEDKNSVLAAVGQNRCVYCRASLATVLKTKARDWQGFDIYTRHNVEACSVCGWWWSSMRVTDDRDIFTQFSGACGSLCNFDVTDLESPLSEIRSYLTAKYDARFSVHPRKYEEVVASVFRDLGYKVRITAYSGDGGIDVILDGSDDITVGVQVKRYQGTIQAEQIRSLLGALVLGGHTSGAFVTTSRFSRGAERSASQSRLRGVPIELFDASRFYDALKIAQRKAFSRDGFLEGLPRNDAYINLGREPDDPTSLRLRELNSE